MPCTCGARHVVHTSRSCGSCTCKGENTTQFSIAQNQHSILLQLEFTGVHHRLLSSASFFQRIRASNRSKRPCLRTLGQPYRVAFSSLPPHTSLPIPATKRTTPWVKETSVSVSYPTLKDQLQILGLDDAGEHAGLGDLAHRRAGGWGGSRVPWRQAGPRRHLTGGVVWDASVSLHQVNCVICVGEAIKSLRIDVQRVREANAKKLCHDLNEMARSSMISPSASQGSPTTSVFLVGWSWRPRSSRRCSILCRSTSSR